METILTSFLTSTIRLSTPLLLAAIGQVITQRGGILDLGVEGSMLMGAFISALVTLFTDNLLLGIISGVAIGVLMGLLMAFLSVTLRLQQVLCGMAVFFLGLGLTSYLYGFIAPLEVAPLEQINIPILSQIPIVGPAVFSQNVLVYLSLILVPISSIILFRTTFGLKIRTVGENPVTADSFGVNVYRIRYICIILGGVLAGLAGSYLTVGLTGVFRNDMVVGRGFIAVALVYFGKWNPYRTLIGALLFGGLFALQMQFQITGIAIPYEFVLMMPYILTIIVLILIGRRASGPAALGIPYKRGEK